MYTEVAKVEDIPEGTMKHVEHHDKDLVIAHVKGKFYAMNDRCGHMKALLSMGKLQGTEIICPMHFAHFDMRTGKVTRPPQPENVPDMDKLPAEMVKMLENVDRMVSAVKTHDLKTYEVIVVGNSIQVNF
ncbi:MAG: Rieske (2Fe-2S) domain-containing protein [Promethearchaeota archaeon CR_4]|nr:MAG: Rieske (2Fe-2S) domain-containing protein [Candidatus Lokiarchaeota archaeon CR_4]